MNDRGVEMRLTRRTKAATAFGCSVNKADETDIWRVETTMLVSDPLVEKKQWLVKTATEVNVQEKASADPRIRLARCLPPRNSPPREDGKEKTGDSLGERKPGS